MPDQECSHLTVLLAFARQHTTSVAVKRFSPNTVVVDLPPRAREVYPTQRGHLGDYGELFRVRLGNHHYHYADNLEDAAWSAMRAHPRHEETAHV